MRATGFVIKSGDGFLFNPETMSFIRHSRTPRIAAKQARRYLCADDAADDLDRLRRHGITAMVEAYLVACKRGS